MVGDAEFDAMAPDIKFEEFTDCTSSACECGEMLWCDFAPESAAPTGLLLPPSTDLSRPVCFDSPRA